MTDSDRTNTNEKTTGSDIQAVSNSIDVVDTLMELGGEATLAEIADRTAISKSSVHKHLRTLENGDFVTTNEGKYALGLRFLEIGGYIRHKHPGRWHIKQKMWELAEETNEIAFFTVEENGRPVILFREVGHNGVPTRSRVGKRLYLHQIAAGKAILAEYPRSRVEEIINQHGLPAATENTITSPNVLYDELDEIREQGYATSIGEATEGLKAVGVSLTQSNGDVLGACAVGGPIHRMNESETEDEVLRILNSITNELELSITYS